MWCGVVRSTFQFILDWMSVWYYILYACVTCNESALAYLVLCVHCARSSSLLVFGWEAGLVAMIPKVVFTPF